MMVPLHILKKSKPGRRYDVDRRKLLILFVLTLGDIHSIIIQMKN